MKNTYLIFCVLSCLMISAIQPEKFPEAEISNGLIRARFYLPDSNKGYYRATRFDWSGIIPSLEYKGHSFYGQWFGKYSPLTNDAVMGPAEEFAQVGYTEAKTGGRFIKIGVGALSKPDDLAYSSFKLYEIVNPGKWEIKKKSDQIQFIHELNDAEYSYEYKKTIQLTKGKPELVLTHTLRNTGRRTIETDVYNHNFLVIDKQPTGPGYVIKFPFNVSGKISGIGKTVQIEGNQMIFLRELTKSENVYCGALQGLSNNSKDYDLKIENLKTGAGVKITGDQPVSRLGFWSSSTTVCPEPYTQIKVEPGQEFTWKIFYEYYTFNI